MAIRSARVILALANLPPAIAFFTSAGSASALMSSSSATTVPSAVTSASTVRTTSCLSLALVVISTFAS